MLRESLHHLVALVEPQETGVHEDAGELVADRLVDQRGGNRRIDAAGKSEDHLVAADLLADARHRLRHEARHVPARAAAADLVHEARVDRASLLRVRHFRMELHRVEAARFVGHARERAGGILGDQLEARWKLGHLVAVAHPYVEEGFATGVRAVLDALEQARVAAHAHFRIAELAHLAGFHLPAQLRGHGLHAVADAEHGNTQLEHRLRRARRLLLRDRGVAAGKDDSPRIERAHEIRVNVMRMELAVHARFPHPPRDQLSDLGAEIEDEYPVQGGILRARKAERRRSAARGSGGQLGLSQHGSSGLPW